MDTSHLTISRVTWFVMAFHSLYINKFTASAVLLRSNPEKLQEDQECYTRVRSAVW